MRVPLFRIYPSLLNYLLRVIHVVDLTFFVVYLAVLANYILKPSNQVAKVTVADWRSISIIIYSLSFLCKKPFRPKGDGRIQEYLPFALTLLAFVTSLFLSPRSDSAYVLLLLALSLHLIQLQLPFKPSPVFVSPSTTFLPISCIFQTFISHIIIPASLFFLPLLMLVAFLLSISLSDVFVWTHWGSSMLVPAPENARMAFMALSCIVLLLYSCLVTSMILASPSSPPINLSVHPWDVYGPKVGLYTRSVFLNTVLHYSSDHYFPAPLNLLQVALVQLPSTVLHTLGRKDLAKRYRNTVEPVCWRISVLPTSLVAAGIWVWGVTSRRSGR